MADALGPSLRRLQDYLYENSNSYATAFLDSDVMVAEPFDKLMDQLRDMMDGYENEQVHALYKEMEEVMATEGRESYEKTRSNMMLVKEIKDLKTFFEESLASGYEEKIMNKIIVICEQLCNIRYNSNVRGEDAVGGFDQEVETLLDQLIGTCTKQFQIISISGMAGLGKTTLARKLYNDPLIEYKFDFRAWTCVSQVHLKKDMLLGILSSFIDDLTDEIYKMSDQQLGEKLYRLLKGRQYCWKN